MVAAEARRQEYLVNHFFQGISGSLLQTILSDEPCKQRRACHLRKSVHARAQGFKEKSHGMYCFTADV